METVLPREVRKLASAIEEKNATIAHRDNQIQAIEFRNEEHQQEILRLNEEINDLIANRHVARHGCFDNVCVLSKRTAKKFTHTTLFDVNTSSLKSIRDSLNLVTQAWR